MTRTQKYFFISFFSIIFSIQAQKSNGIKAFINSEGDLNALTQYALRNNFKGGMYLFKKWNREATIKTLATKYNVSGINFNIDSGNFELKVSKDSVFVLNSDNIEFIKIENQLFKYNIFNNNKFTQVIYESKNLSLYKTYVLHIKKGTYNPLNGDTTPNSYVSKVKYILIKNNVVKNNFVLKKKNLLKLFSDQKSKIESFVKKNKLNFKKEKDVSKIFDFYSKL